MFDAPQVPWVLTDWYGSRFGDHVFPKAAIHSAEQLRAALEGFVDQEPRLLNLDSPDGFRVGIGIGGPLGVVEVYGRTDGQPSLIAVADKPTVAEDRCFVGDWQPSYFIPKHLLPVGQVIALAVELFQTRTPSRCVRWE